MICVSLAEPTLGECLAALVGLPFAEIRLDRMEGLSLEDVGTLSSSHERLIATCAPGSLPDNARKARLLAAVAAGAAYVDVELWRRSHTGRRSSQRRESEAAGSSFPSMIMRRRLTGRDSSCIVAESSEKGRTSSR